MKTLKSLTFLMAFTALVGCKNSNESKNDDTLKANETVGLSEDAKGTEDLNRSDVAFGEALVAYSNNEYKKAGELLATGAKELTREAKTKGSIFNDELDTSIKHITDISKEIQNGQKVDVNALRTMIANAEINVNHQYLASDDIYMEVEPEKINDLKLQRTLEHNLTSLEAGTAKLEGDAKKEGQQLEVEGKKLKDELEAWKNRVEDHAKKSETHFKMYQPEYVYSYGIYPLFKE